MRANGRKRREHPRGGQGRGKVQRFEGGNGVVLVWKNVDEDKRGEVVGLLQEMYDIHKVFCRSALQR